MTAMRKHLGKIVLLGIVLVAGYFVFNKENVSGYAIPFFPVSQKDAVKIGTQVIATAKSAAKENLLAQINSFGSEAIRDIGTFVQNSIDTAKTEAFTTLKTAVVKKVESLSTDLGVSTAPPAASGAAAANTIQSAIKAGSLAYFTIRNNEQDTVNYIIDWKDGKSENSQILKGQAQIVSHSWSKVGEYILQFKIESSNGTNEYQITISIL